MRPRGQTPRMLRATGVMLGELGASMRPRGQTPRMPGSGSTRHPSSPGFNEAAGADPADADLEDLDAVTYQ